MCLRCNIWTYLNFCWLMPMQHFFLVWNVTFFIATQKKEGTAGRTSQIGRVCISWRMSVFLKEIKQSIHKHWRRRTLIVGKQFHIHKNTHEHQTSQLPWEKGNNQEVRKGTPAVYFYTEKLWGPFSVITVYDLYKPWTIGQTVNVDFMVFCIKVVGFV